MKQVLIFIAGLVLLNTGGLYAQTVDSKDVQIAKQKLRVGSDDTKYVTSISDTITSSSTHRQMPTAKAVYEYGLVSGGGISDFISTGLGNPPAAAASDNAGETWRNMSTGELWLSDGTNWLLNLSGTGDKGDITVNSTATTYTIDNSTITSAKILDGTVALGDLANMATASLYYRKTAGSGPPEVNSLATLKNDLNVVNTASNGLTVTSNDVKIGGTFIQNTAIDGAFDFKIGNTTRLSNLVFGTDAITFNLSTNKFLHTSGGGGGGGSYENLFLGWGAGNGFSGTGYANTVVGREAGLVLAGTAPNASGNTLVGYGTAKALTTGSYNAVYGSDAGAALTDGNTNSFFGRQAGTLCTTCTGDVFLGKNSGATTTTGSDNIIIGRDRNASTATASNELNIGSTIFATGIYGGTGLVGINTAAPSATLHVKTGNGVTSAMQRWENTSIDYDLFGMIATPEGAITGSPGDIANGVVSGVGSMFQKESGNATNTGWKQMLSTGNMKSNVWALTGNAATAGTHFLGTTNNVSLRVRTNNVQRMVVDSVGFVGIGVTPSVQFHIYSDGAATVPVQRWHNSTNQSVDQYVGVVTPEGAITAPPGAVWNGTIASGATGISYTKVTGVGNTGWFENLNGSNFGNFAWGLNGNTIGSNYRKLGPLDSRDLNIITNNTVRVRVDSADGNVSIGGPLTSGNKLYNYGKLRTHTAQVGNAVNASPTGKTFMVADTTNWESRSEFRNNRSSTGHPKASVKVSLYTNSDSGDVKLVFSSPAEQHFIWGYDASDGRFKLCINDADSVGIGNSIIVKNSREVGFQVLSPSAKVDIDKTDTDAEIPSLKIEDGTSLTTAQANSIENDKGLLYTKSNDLRMNVVGVVKDFYSNAGNASGGAETDLYSWSSPANTLAVDGDKLTATYGGIATNNPLRMKIVFAGNTLLDTGVIEPDATGAWVADVMVMRTSSTTARVVGRLTVPLTPPYTYTFQSTVSSLSFTGSNILKVTGFGDSADFVVAQLGSIKFEGRAKE